MDIRENEPFVNNPPVVPQKKKEGFWDLIKFAILAILIVVPIRAFVAQPFIVSGSSMIPTFKNSDYLIVDEISYKFEAPKRGDVIVFKWPKDTSKYFIKRIIGLPGETVKIKGSLVTIINKDNPNGLVLGEPYVENKSDNTLEITLPDDQYFVMGDNRSGSSDSRAWGNLPSDLIVGRALVRLFPVNKISLLPGVHNDYQNLQ